MAKQIFVFTSKEALEILVERLQMENKLPGEGTAKITSVHEAGDFKLVVTVNEKA